MYVYVMYVHIIYTLYIFMYMFAVEYYRWSTVCRYITHLYNINLFPCIRLNNERLCLVQSDYNDS